MFKTIVITMPDFFDGEDKAICRLLRREDINLLHLRKPGADVASVRTLLESIPADLHSRIVIHDHFLLAEEFHLYGIHLNSRNPTPPAGWKGSISRSCHSLEEVVACKERLNYVSLSPIFDSISKQGYHSAFSREQICQAKENGTIDEKVFALGGVTFQRIPEIKEMGFGGCMILGDAWR